MGLYPAKRLMERLPDKHQEIISHTVYKIASPYIIGPN